MDGKETLQHIAKLAVESDRKKDYNLAIKYYLQVEKHLECEYWIFYMDLKNGNSKLYFSGSRYNRPRIAEQFGE